MCDVIFKMDLNDEGVVLPAPLRAFDCSANEVIQFKLIRDEKDVEREDNGFAPELSHQIFGENERIFGYKNLTIDLYCLSCSLDFYLHIHFDEKINPLKGDGFQADDLIECLSPWIPSSTERNLDRFLDKVKNQSLTLPFGEELINYSNGDKNRHYSIHRVNSGLSDDKELVAWHNRLQTFLVFFVDAASPIDIEDPRWTIYLLYEQYKDLHTGQMCHAVIGYITVYLYYAYPDAKRPRISQVLILPPFQRQGHGRRLLTAIYNDLRQDARVHDITAEDPSEEFIALRDLVSLELCQSLLAELFSRPTILQSTRLSTEMIDQARRVCKLTKQQTRRVYELSLLLATNEHDEKQMKQFRLVVKQRLFEPLQFNKRRSVQFADPALQALATDPDKRKSYLANEFNDVLQHYQNILRSYEKFH